jgi:lipopolysaccharide transport system ATP-binding protein
VWSLRDINFEVQQGEVLGIIGRNGAGKSTLLKILSKVTGPTTGSVKIKGRVASLLEVGTGFNPQLSGRENIFLNGAILGMKKNEIQQKFDEIVAFSGVEKYIDTPVKRYSSGMYVRLAFAVAAHLEPEILIVDEVLAVGDAEFQKKCLGKMKDVSGQGRTVLFVSHNMAAVKSLCSRAIMLENGTLVKEGQVDDVVSYYLSGTVDTLNPFRIYGKGEIGISDIWLESFGVKAVGKDFNTPILMNDEVEVMIGYHKLTTKLERLDFHFRFKAEDGVYIFNTSSGYLNESSIRDGSNIISMIIPKHFLTQGTYFIDFSIIENKSKRVLLEQDIICFAVNPDKKEMGTWMGKGKSYLIPRFEWKLQ